MVDDVSDIAQYYDSDPENEDKRLDQHQLEFDLTWRYLDQYLPAQGSILEIGAATGKYTVELARRGYSVTAVDLSAALLDGCKKRVAGAGLEGKVQFYVGDARNLGEVPGSDFDAVLLMGPLYHLIEEADRSTALEQAFGRLRKGGIIFSTMLSRFGVIGDLIKNNPGWVDDQTHVESFLANGRRPDEYPRGGFRAYFVRIPEATLMYETAGYTTIVLAGLEPGISADDDSYNRLEGMQRKLWLDIFYRISREESIIGASRHLLYIGRKK